MFLSVYSNRLPVTTQLTTIFEWAGAVLQPMVLDSFLETTSLTLLNLLLGIMAAICAMWAWWSPSSAAGVLIFLLDLHPAKTKRLGF